MTHHLQFEHWVPFHIERVFAFFSNPDNLPRLMPPASGTKIIRINRVAPPFPPAGAAELAAGVGSTIVTSFRAFPLLPIRAQWIARITEFEWNHHFADVQDKGPFKSWHHRHEFVAARRDGIDGTLVRDVIDYHIGFGFVGRIANRFFVRRQMENTFAERQNILPELLS
jgi:ligand-binding SRPBCC domain-containing protein